MGRAELYRTSICSLSPLAGPTREPERCCTAACNEKAGGGVPRAKGVAVRPDRLALTPDLANAPPASGELDIFVRKLLSHSALGPDDQQALRLLPYTARRLDAGDYILREGER